MLRSLRLRDVHDTGPDQHLTAGGALYRIPADVAGLVRAAVLERHTQLAQNATTSPGAGAAAALFAGPDDPETVIGELALQHLLDRTAADTGVVLLPPAFRDVEVHDLSGAW